MPTMTLPDDPPAVAPTDFARSRVDAGGSVPSGAGTGRRDTISLFGVAIDRLTRTEAARRVLAWVGRPRTRCRIVVTPNVDHVVLLARHAGLRAVYADADLVLADGAPVVWTSRLAGTPLPERVTGSDLVPAIFDEAQAAADTDGNPRRLRVFLLGAGPGVGDRAAAAIGRRWPAVTVVGIESPPVGFHARPEENERLLAAIAAAAPDLLLVGLGAPKQELWIHAHADRLAADVALGIGATIDFLAGEKPRAPAWMRRSGLEWVHRLASEPGRLARRYAKDAVLFPPLAARQIWRSRLGGG